jgi:hypothetical protein
MITIIVIYMIMAIIMDIISKYTDIIKEIINKRIINSFNKNKIIISFFILNRYNGL